MRKRITLWVMSVILFMGVAEAASTNKSTQDIYPVYPTVTPAPQYDAALVKKGEYLVKAGDCIACHTNMNDGGKLFAGGLPFDTPFGIFYSTNITPDKETGIGKWSVEDFITAMRHGKSPEGSNYFPVFPYIYFSGMREADLRAIFAYLQSLPPINQPNKDNEVPFPFNVRFAQYGWKTLFFYPYQEEITDDKSQSPEWNRGRYLVDGPGHCGMCHTPLNPMGGPKRSYYLTGGFVDGYWAPNITGEGLKSASVEDIVKVFRTNMLLNNAGHVAGGMAEVNHNSLSQLSDADLRAIAIYLKAVKSDQPMGLEPSTAEPTIERGKTVYYASCVACHAEGQAGAPVIGDTANWFKRIQKQGIDKFYLHAKDGFNNMPIRGGCVTCSDNDVIAAVDFLLEKSLSHAQQLALKAKKQEVSSGIKIKKPEMIYADNCAVCHDKKHQGALSITDAKGWGALLQIKSMDELFASTIKGSNSMPPKGGCAECSNAEVIEAVKYMVEQSQGSKPSLW